MHPYADKVMFEAKTMVIQVYAKLYKIINVEYLAKMVDLGADKIIEITTAAIKENGMKDIVAEDKKTISVSLMELNINKKIFEKGKELEEKTKKLQDSLVQKGAESA